MARKVYIKNKVKKAEYVGILTEVFYLKSDISDSELEKVITKLNTDDTVDGIIIQLPLPEKFNESKFLDLVDPRKDVDGFSVKNQGALFEGRANIIPATPKGILNLINEYEIDVCGKNVLVVGTSLIVGRPIGLSLLLKNATVTFSNIHTKNLKKLCQMADIVISAAGVINLITKDMIKKDSIIIDVGINFLNGKTVGDCDYINLLKKAKMITPVPGGVGPMTINALLENTYNQYLENIKEIKK